MKAKISYQNYLEATRIHFIGIGGVSMSALAEFCIYDGKTVSGSDLFIGESAERLIKKGAFICKGHSAENVINADLVVYTSAVADDNPEIVSALALGIALLKRSEFLCLISERFDYVVAVSGCHGKTTATAMLTEIAVKGGKFPTCFIGGEKHGAGNLVFGGKDLLIEEACEYRKNMLDLKADVAVILNLDDDHLDCYGDLNGVKKAFWEFAKGKKTVINADDVNSAELLRSSAVTFGIKNTADYRAEKIRLKKSGYAFSLSVRGKKRGTVRLAVRGIHNIYNALAAIAEEDLVGVDFAAEKTALENFKGVGRRLEYLGELLGCRAYADYAHHPSEISATLKVFDEYGKKRTVIFQPHTYSRTKRLMDSFVNVLSREEKLIIFKTYPAREKFDLSGSAYALFHNLEKTLGKKVCYADDYGELIAALKKSAAKAEEIVFLGAGDIFYLAKKVIAERELNK